MKSTKYPNLFSFESHINDETPTAMSTAPSCPFRSTPINRIKNLSLLHRIAKQHGHKSLSFKRSSTQSSCFLSYTLDLGIGDPPLYGGIRGISPFVLVRNMDGEYGNETWEDHTWVSIDP
jgi:hypothetical protein